MSQITTSMLKSLVVKLENTWWATHTIGKEQVLYFDPSIKTSKNFKISICTTNMNRFNDLIKTFPHNLERCLYYEPIEFVVLDYNSNTKEIGEWLFNKYKNLIDEGKIVYFRTEDPKFYSMSHSRNMAFKIASGEIVMNVDADNMVEGNFPTKVNKMANLATSDQYFFAKSLRNTNGRIGFFKSSFIKLLGGYDENFLGYGHDDKDIMYRAWCLGFKMLRLGGDDSSRIKTDNATKVANYDKTGVEGNWKFTEQWNKLLSYVNLYTNQFTANENKKWGSGWVSKNFGKPFKI